MWKYFNYAVSSTRGQPSSAPWWYPSSLTLLNPLPLLPSFLHILPLLPLLLLLLWPSSKSTFINSSVLLSFYTTVYLLNYYKDLWGLFFFLYYFSLAIRTLLPPTILIKSPRAHSPSYTFSVTLRIPFSFSLVHALYVLTVFSLLSSTTGTARFTKQGKGEKKGAGFEGGSIRYALDDKKGEDMT